ncbi:MAG: hypothetical protein LUF30_07220 [Lachnospiraceae bacterium]|nr:hypothetical protein [Lachnospiraceae bacterium]
MLPEEGVVLPRRGQGKSGVIRQVKRICPAPVTDALAKKMGADTLAQYRELCRDKLLKAE